MTALTDPILFNTASGSDTAASGSGPATAVSGNGASLDGTSTVDLSANTPDLSGVAAGDLLWVDASSGRQFSVIASVDDGADTVTCDDAFTPTESSRNWGIGGKRATLDNANSRRLFSADFRSNWIVELEDNQTLTSTSLDVSPTVGSQEVRIRGASGSKKKIIQSAASVRVIDVTSVDCHLSNLHFTNTNATPGGGVYTNAGYILAQDCIFGDETDQLSTGVGRSSGNARMQLWDCTVHHCTSHGISVPSGSSYCNLFKCLVVDNGGKGIRTDNSSSGKTWYDTIFARNAECGAEAKKGSPSSPNQIRGCTFDFNTGDGLELGTTGDSCVLEDNIFSNNGGWGVDNSGTANDIVRNYNNNYYNNTSGARRNVDEGENETTLDPQYADAANNNFQVNNESLSGQAHPISPRKFAADASNSVTSRYPGAIQKLNPVVGQIVDITEFDFPPRFGSMWIKNGPRLQTSFQLEGVDDAIAHVFRWRYPDTVIDKVHFKHNNVSTSTGPRGTVSVSIYNVDTTADPTEPSTVITGATWTSGAITSPNDDYWTNEGDLGTNPTLVSGTLYAIVINLETEDVAGLSLPIPVSDGYVFPGENIEDHTMTRQLGGAWALDSEDFLMGVAVEDTVGTFYCIGNVLPPNAHETSPNDGSNGIINQVAVGTGSTHDEIGNEFTSPVAFRSPGPYATLGDHAGDGTIYLYTDLYGTPTVVAECSFVWEHSRSDTDWGSRDLMWDSGPVTIAANTVYGIALKGTDATESDLAVCTVSESGMLGGLPGRITNQYIERDSADAGNRPFTKNNLKQVLGIGLRGNGVGDGSAAPSGGGGGDLRTKRLQQIGAGAF